MGQTRLQPGFMTLSVRRSRDSFGFPLQRDLCVPLTTPPCLGHLLVAQGCITGEDLAEALRLQKTRRWAGKRLGTILLRLGRLAPEQLARALSQQARLAAAAAVLPLVLAVAEAGPALAGDGSLGSSSSATTRISLIVPERPAGALGWSDGTAEQSLRLCLTGTNARALRRYYGDPARPPERTPVLRLRDCDLAPEPAAAGHSPQALLVLEPE